MSALLQSAVCFYGIFWEVPAITLNKNVSYVLFIGFLLIDTLERISVNSEIYSNVYFVNLLPVSR